MEFRHLKYFLETANSGSLSKASAVLGVGQPSLGRQIRQLEDELGARLFYRNGRGVILTAEGNQFRARVEPLLNALLQTRSEFQSQSEIPAGTLSVGILPGVADAVGGAISRKFLERFPQVKLSILEGFTGFFNELLLSQRLDLAVMARAQRMPVLHMDPLITVPFFAVLHRDLARPEDIASETMRFERICDFPLILMSRNHGMRWLIENAAGDIHRELTVAADVDGENTTRILVQSGIAATIQPKSSPLVHAISDNATIARRIVDPEISTKYHIAYPAQSPTSQAAREFVKLLRAEVRQAVARGRL